MRKPYVGITGFTAVDEVQVAMSKVHSYADGFGEYSFMNGVLSSQRSLKGLEHNNPQLKNRYIPASRTGKLFPSSDKALNLYHHNTPNKQFLPELEQLIHFGGPNLHGFQLNIAWPDPKEIEKFRKAGHNEVIVLQIGGHAFAKIDHNPKKLVERVKAEYIDLIDYILLDPSGGWGKELDVNVMRGYLRQIYKNLIHEKIGIGAAGGISPYNAEKIVVPLVSEYAKLSLDLEGSVRNKNKDELMFTEMGKAIEMYHKYVVSR